MGNRAGSSPVARTINQQEGSRLPVVFFKAGFEPVPKSAPAGCFFLYVDLSDGIRYNNLTTHKENRHETHQEN